jgi:outer membrane biosynthesis protein TonB
MTLQEVQKLIDAGFSHDEIMSFQQNPQENPQPEPQPEPDPQPEPEPEPDPQQEPEQHPDYNALNETMNRLIKTIQASNLQNNTRDSIPVADLNKQVDDIMKSIIRPEKEENK